MLVIKIIHSDVAGFKTTYLYEANTPSYSHDAVVSYQEWCDYIKKHTDGYRISSVSFLNNLQEDDFNGTTPIPFTRLYFWTGDGTEELVLFIRRASVYIMNEGKTVDTFYC